MENIINQGVPDLKKEAENLPTEIGEETAKLKELFAHEIARLRAPFMGLSL